MENTTRQKGIIKQGKMPTLERLIRNGVYANMSTMDPPFSPMLWTSVATGKTPDKHGILNFIEVNDTNEIQPVPVTSRKTRAVWNIFTQQNLVSNVVGWWPTIIKECRMHYNEVTAAHVLPFIPKASEIPKKNQKFLLSLSKILSQNTSVHAAATYLMEHTEWDFMAVYYDGIDHFCHSFMKFHPPKLNAIPEELFEMYKGVIEGAYRYQDMMLERKLKLAGEETTVIVMSDHGYESGNRRMKIFGLNLFDIAPTLLHHFDLPVGKDMDGKPILDMYTDPKPIKYIDSWDSVTGKFGEHDKIITIT